MPYIFNPFTGNFDNTVPLSGGKVPAEYLPSYVDDVVEYASLAAFPATGETGKIYLALDTSTIYRWSGSQYVLIGSNVSAINDLSDIDTSTTAPTDGQALVWEQATGKWEPGSVATTAQGALADTALQPTSSIDDLADVDTSTTAPTDGQVLTWDQAAGKWEPGSVATSAQGALADTALQPTSSIDALADVDTSTTAPTDGQVLAWNNTLERFEPTTVVASQTLGITGASAITNIVQLSQANYDAIVTPDANTLYVIV